MGETGLYTCFNSKDLSHSEKISLIALTSTLWKYSLIPLDTLTNIYQVRGLESKSLIKHKLQKLGFVKTFYSGGSLYLSNMFIGSYIWYTFYMIFDKTAPILKYNDLRNAGIGFSCTLITDLTLNPLRIIKTYKQSSPLYITYMDSFKKIVVDKGLSNYLGRGLRTRLILNCINSSIYVVLWKRIENYLIHK